MPNLSTAADGFSRWMNRHEKQYRQKGRWENHNLALMDYLEHGQDCRGVTTHAEFCQLSDLVKAKGYTQASNPPCTPVAFANTIDEANYYKFREAPNTIPKGMRIRIAAYAFDRWMKRARGGEKHPTVDAGENYNLALTKYLTHDYGWRFIRTYQEFCQLSDLVQAKGYTQASTPPCTPEMFNVTITKISSRSMEFSVFGSRHKAFEHPIPALPRLSTLCNMSLLSKEGNTEAALQLTKHESKTIQNVKDT